ncbi:MAG: hypothetical protein ABI873_12570 [Marmoricola sp.]
MGDLFKVGQVPVPPSYDELANAGLVAPEDDADRWFSPEEQLTAAWLRDRGLGVRSVQRREGRYLKTPDAAAPEFAVTIEAKRAVATNNAIVQRIRSARWQARHVVVDLRGSGASRGLAESAMRAALRMYGTQLDEVILIVADDLGVGWSHG